MPVLSKIDYLIYKPRYLWDIVVGVPQTIQPKLQLAHTQKLKTQVRAVWGQQLPENYHIHQLKTSIHRLPHGVPGFRNRDQNIYLYRYRVWTLHKTGPCGITDWISKPWICTTVTCVVSHAGSDSPEYIQPWPVWYHTLDLTALNTHNCDLCGITRWIWQPGIHTTLTCVVSHAGSDSPEYIQLWPVWYHTLDLTALNTYNSDLCGITRWIWQPWIHTTLTCVVSHAVFHSHEYIQL